MVVEGLNRCLTEVDTGGWLSGAECCPSPNTDCRPDASDISLLVIHNISLPPGQFGTGCVEKFFCNQLDFTQHSYFESIKELKVSSHLLIERTGRVVQFVPFTARAWHAGLSSFEGRERCNDFSIGIELEGQDHQAYTESQYRVLVQVSKLLFAAYPQLNPARVVGHCDIAPGRKTDPGDAFDWHKYKERL